MYGFRYAQHYFYILEGLISVADRKLGRGMETESLAEALHLDEVRKQGGRRIFLLIIEVEARAGARTRLAEFIHDRLIGFHPLNDSASGFGAGGGIPADVRRELFAPLPERICSKAAA